MPKPKADGPFEFEFRETSGPYDQPIVLVRRTPTGIVIEVNASSLGDAPDTKVAALQAMIGDAIQTARAEWRKRFSDTSSVS